MTLTPAMDTAMQADGPLVFVAVELDFPGFTLRLVDGAGSVTFGGNTFVSPDPTYGSLGVVGSIDDGINGQAPRVTLAIMPPTLAAAGALAAAAAQGSAVSIWFGAVNRLTGAVIASPDLMFVGFVDVPTLMVGQNTFAVSIDVGSEWELFFDTDDGLGLNNVSHQAIWPGELGCSMVTTIDRQIAWGFANPAISASVTPGNSIVAAIQNILKVI